MSNELQEILAHVEAVVLKDVESGRALRAIVAYLAQLEATLQAAPTPTAAPTPSKSAKGDTSNGN